MATIYNLSRAARRIGVTESTVREWIAKDRFPDPDHTFAESGHPFWEHDTILRVVNARATARAAGAPLRSPAGDTQ